MDLSNSSQAIDAPIVDEEQNGKQKEKERNRERVPNPVTQDNLVSFYNTQGSYGEPILFTSLANEIQMGGIHISNVNVMKNV